MLRVVRSKRKNVTKKEKKMKRLITICAVVLMVFAMNSMASASLSPWEIKDAGLQDETNFVQQTGGTLNSRTDIPGDPGTSFNITLSGSSETWAKVQIGDGFDLPFDNAGIVAATGNSGNLTAYSGYTMTLTNTSNGWFAAVIYMNTGWTDSPWGELDRYYQDTKDWTWLAPGQTATLTLDFSDTWLCSENYVWDPVSEQTVLNLNHVSNIGFQIGSNMGEGEYHMPSCTEFSVAVIPEPATIALLGLGALSLIRRKR